MLSCDTGARGAEDQPGPQRQEGRELTVRPLLFALELTATSNSNAMTATMEIRTLRTIPPRAKVERQH